MSARREDAVRRLSLERYNALLSNKGRGNSSRDDARTGRKEEKQAAELKREQDGSGEKYTR